MTADIVFRAGREGDQPQIAEMTRDIWEGEDYLAKVWEAWVRAPNSLVQVGLLGKQIVAAGRVVELAPGEWWLEGLRVHPAYQGQGLATPLHDHLVGLALHQPGLRTFGLATSARNQKVAHLAARSGMDLQTEYRFLKGPARAESVPAIEAWHGDVAALMARLRAGPWLRRSQGYVMHGWVARRFDEKLLTALVAAGGAWQGGGALALMGGDGHGDTRFWLYLLDGGSDAEQAALVRHARHLAYQRAGDESFVRCFAPPGEALQRPLFAGGLHDADEGAFHVLHFARTVNGAEQAEEG